MHRSSAHTAAAGATAELPGPREARSHPTLAAVPRITPDSPERFINRELSWLDFNHRVVEEAENARHPLLERVRFVSISASNLDEFYSVRVAGLVGQAKAGLTTTSPDGRTPAQQLAEIRLRAESLLADQQRVWRELRGLLRDAGIEVCEPASLTEDDRHWLDAWFMERVFPVLTPLAIDPAHPFPFIPNMGLVMALLLLRRGGRAGHARPDPAAQPGGAFRPPARAQPPGSRSASSCWRIWSGCSSTGCSPASSVTGQGLFRLIRDTDVEFEEEAEDLVRSYETALKRRRRGVVIHLGMDAGMPDELRGLVADQLDATEDEIHVAGGVLGVADLRQLIVDDRPGPAVPALHAALPGAHPRLRRRLLRRDPRQGHHRPPPVRELRRGGAVPAPGGAGPGGDRGEADAVPHQPRLPHREGADRGGGGGQVRHRGGGAARPLRRGDEHPPRAQPGGGRRAGGVRLRRTEDTRETVAGGAARGQFGALLRAFRHRQLPPDHRAHLPGPELLHLRPGPDARCRAAVQLHDRLRPARRRWRRSRSAR